MTSEVLERNQPTLNEPGNFPPMKVHNALLDDRAALDRAWETDGYWFFKGVLDTGALARLRQVMVTELEKKGVVDPALDDADGWDVRYNGGDLSNLRFRLETLAESQPWQEFVYDPAIQATITDILGDEPFWLPIVEYRTTAPAEDKKASRFEYIHQDGPYSRGIPFRIVWIPLSNIDQSVGGMAIAEGMSEARNRHPIAADGANMPIPLDAVPKNCWRQTICEPGDILLMNMWTPHTSFRNHSDRFRLSLDHRVMAKSDGVPIVGNLQSMTPKSVTVTHEGRPTTLRIESDTYFRTRDGGGKLADDSIVSFFEIGEQVLVGYAGDKVVSIRPVLL